MMLVTATARVEQIAWNFLRIIGFLCFGMTCLVTFWSLSHGPEDAESASDTALKLGIAAAVTAFVLVFGAGLAGRRPGVVRLVCLVGGVLAVVASCLTFANRFGAAGPSGLALTLAMVGHVLGTLLLGSISVAWLLGHAYLTATKMTIAPLRHFSALLLWVVGARVLYFLGAVGVPLLVESIDGAPSSEELINAWLLLSLRVGVGLLLVGVFAYMVWDCVRRRSTQSATGILYFGSVLAYVGELSSQFLSLHFDWPV